MEKEQHSKLIQALQDYLDNTSPEQLEQDWKELEKYNQYGPDMEECLELGRQHCIEVMKDEDMSLKEDKELLLKDICARLPYGVRVNYGGYEGCDYKLTLMTLQDFPTEDLKPYLRPMSSMTEEEEQEYHSLCAIQFDELADADTTIFYFDTIESVDWLNKKMFDYRGLISKDLAISTEVFNPYKD